MALYVVLSLLVGVLIIGVLIFFLTRPSGPSSVESRPAPVGTPSSGGPRPAPVGTPSSGGPQPAPVGTPSSGGPQPAPVGIPEWVSGLANSIYSSDVISCSEFETPVTVGKTFIVFDRESSPTFHYVSGSGGSGIRVLQEGSTMFNMFVTFLYDFRKFVLRDPSTKITCTISQDGNSILLENTGSIPNISSGTYVKCPSVPSPVGFPSSGGPQPAPVGSPGPV